MKPRHEKFLKHGQNPHDHSGVEGNVCAKCGVQTPAKAGFRASSLKCPKCGAAIKKRPA